MFFSVSCMQFKVEIESKVIVIFKQIFSFFVILFIKEYFAINVLYWFQNSITDSYVSFKKLAISQQNIALP